MCKEQFNLGRTFENRIYNELAHLDFYDEIYDEKYLRNRFGWVSSGIDFLVIKNNKAYAIQLKWRKTRRRENDSVDKFLQSVKHLKMAFKEVTIIGGFWVSRLEPFKDNQARMKEENVKCIHCFESMEGLIDHFLRNSTM